MQQLLESRPQPLAGVRRQQGLSLVEAMLALFISLVLLTALITVFQGAQRTYRVTEALSRLQENSRFALEVLSGSVRMAGFVGCARPAHVRVNMAAVNVDAFVAEQAVTGRDNIGAGVLEGSRVVIPGTDSITLTGGVGPVGQLGQATAGTSATLLVTGVSWREGSLMLVSDCGAMDVFQLSGRSAVLPGGLSQTYAAGASVMAYQQSTFFISPGISGNPALWRRTEGGQAEELMDGVEDMQVLYGVDTSRDGQVNAYRHAGAVGDWGRVLTVRISLLFASLDERVVDAPQGYRFNGEDRQATDRRLRREASATIAVRNRLL